MDYQDMQAVGNVFNVAIQQVLREYGVDSGTDVEPQLVGAIAEAILIQLDQSNYQIVRKSSLGLANSR